MRSHLPGFAKHATVLTALLLPFSARGDEPKVSFTRDIRPILSNNCFHCHGPDENTREADLRLDTRTGLIGNQNAGVVNPGHADQSELIQRIFSDDADVIMPPSDSNKSLTSDERQLLRRWIEQGATWEQHWAFRQPTDHRIPPDTSNDWCRNEIDRFIFKRLQSAGLHPAPTAPPEILLRRIFLDLIGLPPTLKQTEYWAPRIWPKSDGIDQAEVDQTAIDESQWEALVDELMDSPHYGERWARRWLDLARYADTNGYEKDRDRSIWPYRDWVVNAINQGMPFDRFTVEQLAGDMLPNATQSQKIATGFHRNTMLNEEGGIDPLEFRYHAMTDRVATTGTTWLGLTLGCCQCHTHKYDPVSHTEYFQIFAYLNNADEPYLELQDEQKDQQHERNLAKADEILNAILRNQRTEISQPVDSTITSVNGDALQQFELPGDHLVRVVGDSPESATYRLQLQPEQAFDTIKLLASTPTGSNGPGRTDHGNFVLSEIELYRITADGKRSRLSIDSAEATAEQPGYEIHKAIDQLDRTGWGIHTKDGIPKTVTATLRLTTDEFDFQTEDRLEVVLRQLAGGRHTMGQFRIQLSRKIAQPETQDDTWKSNKEFQKWLMLQRPHAVTWTTLAPVRASSNLPLLTIQDDHSIFASGDTAKRDDYVVDLLPQKRAIRAIRLEALPDERLPARGPGSTYYEGTPGDFYLTEIRFTARGERYRATAASHSFAKNRFGNNPATSDLSIDGDIQTGWSVHGRQGERHVAVFVLEKPIPADAPLRIDMSFGRHFASSLGRFRFAATDSATQPQARDWSPEVANIMARAESTWTAADWRVIKETYVLQNPEFQNQAARIRQLRRRPTAVTSLVFNERPTENPRPTFRHHRGEYLQARERVSTGLPSVLSGQSEAPRDRLEFARWIVSVGNPLTARVVANRHWAAFFGTGIVKTLDDFGLQGDPPSHPDLLDWLAVRLRTDDAWSIRTLHKRIVCSATYRQSGNVNRAAAAVDPENRLLSYSPRFVLDAEIIRDQLLLAAGVLSPDIGGPPVRPPQPDGVTEAAYGKPKWNADEGQARFRRSLYTFAKRTAPFAMFATFDAPSGEACIARRNRSNSPLQALTMLNDTMLMEIAQKSGRRIAQQSLNDDAARLTELFRRTIVRTPTAKESEVFLEYLNKRRSDFRAWPDSCRRFGGTAITDDVSTEEAVETAAWTAVSRALFGLDETLTRE